MPSAIAAKGKAATGSRSVSSSSSSSKKAATTAAAPAAAAAASSSAPSTSKQLIGGHVSSSQALKAITALQTHRKKHRVQLAENRKSTGGSGKSALPLDGEEDEEDATGEGRTADTLYLNLTVKRLAKEKKSKPVLVPLPHSLHPSDSTTVCLFVKDPQRTYKDLLPSLGIKSVHRVIGVSKLRGKFSPYEARRILMDEYDVFLCDDRISPMMPKLLGSKWVQRKKLPVSVNVRHTRHLKAELEKAISSTTFITNKGSQISLPIGPLSSYTALQLLENLAAALPKVISKIPYDGWKNVQAVEIKGGKTASLPVWNAELASRWEGIETRVEESDSEDESEEEDETSRLLPPPTTAAKKSSSSKKVAPIAVATAITPSKDKDKDRKTKSSVSKAPLEAAAGKQKQKKSKA